MSDQNQSLVVQKSQNDVEVKIDPTFWLTPTEKAVLEQFRAKLNTGGYETRPLATTAAIKLYNLYLDCGNLAEIAEINPELEYGAIIHGAIEGDWYNRKKQYLEKLYERANESALQTVSEGAVFISKVLAVAHKTQGNKLSKFLQTQDPKYLEDTIEIKSLQGYKNAVEVLMRLTGQDQVMKVQVSGNVVHEDKALPAPEPKKDEPSPVAVATSISQLAALKRGDKE